MLSFRRTNSVFTVLLLVCFYLIWYDFYSIWIIVLIVVAWIIITTIGSFHIRWNYFLPANHHNYPIKENSISITFDDGPNQEFTPFFLELLKKYNAKATFFCIGKNAEKYPEIVQQIINQGHAIGNHSFAHTNDYGFLNIQQLVEDIFKAQSVLKKISNKQNILFRPPFGVTNPNIAKAIKKFHLQTIGWSVRSYDTKAKDVNVVVKRITKNLKKGDVILLHDTSQLSLSVLEQLLQYLEKQKLHSVSIEQLFKFNTKENEENS